VLGAKGETVNGLSSLLAATTKLRGYRAQCPLGSPGSELYRGTYTRISTNTCTNIILSTLLQATVHKYK